MNNARGSRRRNTKRVHVGHDIVPAALLLHCSSLELGIFNSQMRFHLFEAFSGDFQP